VRRLLEHFGIKLPKDAHYRVRCVSQRNRFAYDGGIAREAPPPELVAQNCYVTSIRALLVLGESSPVKSGSRVQLEEVAGNDGRGNQFRSGAAGQVEVVEPVRRHIVDGDRLPSPETEFAGTCYCRTSTGVTVFQLDDAFCLPIR